MPDRLIDAIVSMQEREALAITRDLLAGGTTPAAVLDCCREAMHRIGIRFERGESFIPELIMAGEMLRQISEIVKPLFAECSEPERIGKVVIGTVRGDIHDIAKDIVVFLLDINGFLVFDLGVDVAPQSFVDKVREVDASIVGLSGFLTLALEPMRETVSLFAQAGLRDRVRIMIGGGPIDEYARQYTGADAWGRDAMAAVSIARGWTISENGGN